MDRNRLGEPIDLLSKASGHSLNDGDDVSRAGVLVEGGDKAFGIVDGGEWAWRERLGVRAERWAKHQEHAEQRAQR